MNDSLIPSVGRVVHYVSYGTPGGEFGRACRAAVITEVGAWLDIAYEPQGEGERIVHQQYDTNAVGLSVQNPTGEFFNRGTKYDGGSPERDPGMCDGAVHNGGTWHWPIRM